MKRVLVIGSMMSASLSFANDSVPCDPAGFRGTVQIAANNGYTWPGDFGSARCSLGDNAAFVWSGPATSSAFLAVTQINPTRIQYKRGGSIDLFCVMLRNGQWVNVGKSCQ